MTLTRPKQSMTDPVKFNTVAELTASNLAYSGAGNRIVQAGEVIEAAGFRYEVAGELATDAHVTTAGGVKLRVLGGFSLPAFGAAGDGVTDDTAAIQLGIDKLHAMHLATGETYRLEVPNGTFIHRPLVVKSGVVLSGKGGVLKLKSGVAVDSTVNYYPISDLGHDNVGFENLIIDGNGAGTENASFNVCDSLTIVGTNSWANNITIRNAPDSGIMFSGAAGGWVDKIRIEGARDVGVYVNAAEASLESEGAWIGRVWAYDCVFSAVAYKRSTTRMRAESIFAKRCGNAVAFEDFGVGGGGAPSLLSIGSIEGHDIGYMHRAAGAAESLISANRAKGIYIGSAIGRNVSGAGFVSGGSENVTIGHLDISGYPTDPRTTGHGNAAVVLDVRDTVKSTGINILSGKAADFTGNGVYLVNATGCRINMTSVAAGAIGLRVNAASSDCVIAGTYDGSAGDLAFYAGATNVNISGCYFPDKTGAIEQRGGQRNASIISPTGTLTPRYIGELCEITASGQRYMATGFSNTDWLSVGPMLVTSAAAIAAATNAVNTQGKHLNKRVWDDTNKREMRASGPLAADTWIAVDGSVTVTPV